MYVKTRLIILHIDFQAGTHRCLLDGGSLPIMGVSDSHPVECGPLLLKKYLEIEPEWVTFTLVNVNNDKDTLFIYYTCMIPNVINNIKGEWTDIGRIEDGIIQRLVFEAGQKILSKL